MTRPNTARVLDYWLGGTHNFEIDRQFSDRIVATMPELPDMQRKARAQLRRVVTQMICEHRLGALADLGAGLPTCDNTHVPAHTIDPDVRVLYSDIDPLTVAYGKQILQGVRNTLYVSADAAHPADLFVRPDVLAFLGAERRLGVISMALGHLMTDEQIRTTAVELAENCAPGSVYFFSFGDAHWNDAPGMRRIIEFYERAGVPIILRSADEMLDLVRPWAPLANGITYNYQAAMPDPNPAPPLPVYSCEFLLSHPVL